ncbi:MAG: InlB B-repeat-containing protein [Agriterribacter sp.]
MKKTLIVGVILYLTCLQHLYSQTTRTASNYTELAAAVLASSDNDIIKFTNNIVVTTEIASAKTLTFNGNGYTITVPVPGLDESGKFNTSPSNFRVFNLSGAKTTTINNLKISGGGLTTTAGGAIYVGSTHTLKINNSTISNSRVGLSSSAGGGGIYNTGGTVYITGCQIIRNAASYGGGFFNTTSGKIFIENTTFSENRSTISAGGGGAGENNSGSNLYINNSTFSNNKSTEIGGAINNSATMYVVNSSFTGNVGYGTTVAGGAIGNNGGTVYAINTLFAYNYRRASGTVTSPTTYSLDDVLAYNTPGNVHLYYCIYHGALATSGVDYSTGHNISYTGNATGTDNTIFSGGILTRITDGTGAEIGDASTGKVFQPYLYDNNGIAPTLKTGSFTLQTANLGTKVGFTSNSGSPIIGYYDRLATTPAWVNKLSTPASSYEITKDQVGTTRNNPSAIGAIQGTVDNLYMLKVNYSADGSVSGGTVYGDVYASGTSVTLTAIPVSGKQFVRWDYVVGGTGTASTSNPYTVIVNKDITLVPIFQTATGGSYSITYAGNDNTAGTAPSTGNYTGSTTIAAVGTLKRSGYIFNGWNTNLNGSGTPYAAGATYILGTNLTLYAQWKDNFWRGTSSTAYATTGNWGSGTVPAANDDIVFAEDATNDLIVDQNRVVGNIQFSGAPYKMVLGNFNITATGVTNYSSTKYVQTNGTGKFTMSIANGTNTFFPVGNSAYNPVSIKNNTGSADAFSVQVLDELYYNGSNGTAVSGARVKRTWDISKSTANGGSGIDLQFNWNAAEAVSITTPALFHYSNGWSKQTAGTTSSTATSLTYTGYTGTFSPFGIANTNSTLPVIWQSFKVQKQGSDALLTWSTATELNNKDFVIERSTDGNTWKAIGTVAAAGNSVTQKTYQFTDTDPAEGINYYRIRQRDLDGQSTFSTIETLKLDIVAKLMAYPNPVTNGVLNVKLKTAGWVNIYSNNGQLVFQKKFATAGKQIISLQTLSKGIYRVISGNESVSIVLQ